MLLDIDQLASTFPVKPTGSRINDLYAQLVPIISCFEQLARKEIPNSSIPDVLVQIASEIQTFDSKYIKKISTLAPFKSLIDWIKTDDSRSKPSLYLLSILSCSPIFKTYNLATAQNINIFISILINSKDNECIHYTATILSSFPSKCYGNIYQKVLSEENIEKISNLEYDHQIPYLLQPIIDNYGSSLPQKKINSIVDLMFRYILEKQTNSFIPAFHVINSFYELKKIKIDLTIIIDDNDLFECCKHNATYEFLRFLCNFTLNPALLDHLLCYIDSIDQNIACQAVVLFLKQYYNEAFTFSLIPSLIEKLIIYLFNDLTIEQKMRGYDLLIHGISELNYYNSSIMQIIIDMVSINYRADVSYQLLIQLTHLLELGQKKIQCGFTYEELLQVLIENDSIFEDILNSHNPKSSEYLCANLLSKIIQQESIS